MDNDQYLFDDPKAGIEAILHLYFARRTEYSVYAKICWTILQRMKLGIATTNDEISGQSYLKFADRFNAANIAVVYATKLAQ